MALAVLDESILTDIGNAIRSKDGSSELIYPTDMAQKIMNIPTGDVPASPTFDTFEDGNTISKIYLDPSALSENGYSQLIQYCNDILDGIMAGVPVDLVTFTSDDPYIFVIKETDTLSYLTLRVNDDLSYSFYTNSYEGTPIDSAGWYVGTTKITDMSYIEIDVSATINHVSNKFSKINGIVFGVVNQ